MQLTRPGETLAYSRQLSRAGRLFFIATMRQRKDCTEHYYELDQIAICNHKRHPLPQDSERVAARPQLPW